MKTALILCALASSAFAATPVLVRITPEALAKLQQKTPMTSLQVPDKSQTAVTRPAEQSIIKDSTILHDGKNWTLVPKGAVIFLPAAMKSRVDVKPVGTLMAWAEFFAKNRAWITTTDVSFEQAAGNEDLPAERVTFWARQDKVVVAVHQCGPISVRVSNEPQSITKR